MPNLVIGQNCYVDVIYADNYFDDRLFSDIWLSVSAENKARALIMASQKIDRQPLRGVKSVFSQIMQFPRALKTDYRYWQYINLSNIDIHYNGYWYIELEVTDNVKNAVCEEALAILKGIPKRIELQRQGVKSVNIGDMSENYGSGKTMALLSQEAKEYLQPYIGSYGLD